MERQLVARRLAALDRFIERTVPDVICLQETKALHPSDDALAVFERLGYKLCHIGGGAYNGVAIASRHPISNVVMSGGFDDEHLDREPPRRQLRGRSRHADSSRQRLRPARTRDRALAFRLQAGVPRLASPSGTGLVEEDHHLVLGGDINVAPTDSDIFHPDAFKGLTHVTPQEAAP